MLFGGIYFGQYDADDETPVVVTPYVQFRSAPVWQFILSDLSGNVHGEVTNADERRVSLPHLRVPTAGFKLPLWHDLAETVMDTDCLLKCYRTDPVTGARRLAFHGPVLTAEEVAEGNSQSVAVSAVGPFWRLTRRLIGKTKSGIGWGLPTFIDLGLIAHNILDTVNADSFTGVSIGTRTPSSDGAAGIWWLKNAAEAIADLHAGLDSFEYVIEPTEPAAVGGIGGWPQIGLMNIAPTLAVNRPDVILEFGTGLANIASYTRSVSREGLLTKGTISLQGWPDAPVSTATSDLLSATADNLATRGLFEDVVPDTGIVYDDLRQSLVDLHVLIRKNPRQIITFKPPLNARPSPFTDYEVGDIIRARAVVSGDVKFDNLFRLWGLSFAIDKNGNEQAELELVIP